MAAHKATRASAAKKAKGRAAAAPWERDNPKGDRHRHLSSQEKSAAKRSAKKAGRPYPNLVDNMHAASGAKK